MPAAPDSDYCVWHDNQLSKADAYVAELLANVIRFAQGDLTEYHLAELDWPHAELSQMVLDGVDLRDAHLPHAQLSQSSLVNANLRRCNLRKANLFGANLRGCDLKHTDLNGADLREADLSGAQLSDTNLLNADLSGANLSNVNAESFRWNEATNFDNVQGLDPQDSDSDETQAFITPIALANYQKEKLRSSNLSSKSSVFQTHEYRNASSANLDSLDKVADALKTQLIEKHASSKELPATAAPIIVDTAPYKKRIRLLSIACAAALFLMIAASAFGFLSMRELENRPVIEKEVIVTKEVIVENNDAPKVTESNEYQLLAKQHKDLVAQNQRLTESYRQFELEIKQHAVASIDQKNAAIRLQLRNDELEHKLDEYNNLQKRYHELKRHTSRLNDTASILAKGVDTLSIENEQLNEIKNSRLNAKSQLDLLQTKTLQLQHENDQLKKDSIEIKEYNQSLLAELSTARKSLERFLSRIEGSRLHAFLTKDATQLKAIALEPGKPIVLTGDHLITLEVNQTGKDTFIESKLFIQRSAQDQIPDVNIIFYNAEMKALRSVSYGFPNRDSKESFAVSTANFNTPIFPSFVRILVNPGVEGELVGGNSVSQLR